MSRTREEEIVALLAAGDHDAFTVLFDLHVQDVFRHSARQLESRVDAEDVTAIVFLEAWRRRQDIRVVNGSARAWLLLTATNVCRNHRRSRRRYRAALARLGPPDLVDDPSDSVIDRQVGAELGRRAAHALATLAPLDRQVVSLCLIGGLTYAEVAEVTGLTHAAVRSRLSRARQRLRDQLDAAGITPSPFDQGSW